MAENSIISSAEFRNAAISHIPIDLFVSKQRKRFWKQGFIRFTDSAGNLVYKVQKLLPESAARDTHCVKAVLDSSDNPLFSIRRVNKSSWSGLTANEGGGNLIFTVEKTVDESDNSVYKVSPVGESNQVLITELLMRGSRFHRACTIYKGDVIVAQTNLMYSLGIKNLFVPRNRFRVTIFPGFGDPSLVAALVAIYFDGRKLWV